MTTYRCSGDIPADHVNCSFETTSAAAAARHFERTSHNVDKIPGKFKPLSYYSRRNSDAEAPGRWISGDGEYAFTRVGREWIARSRFTEREIGRARTLDAVFALASRHYVTPVGKWPGDDCEAPGCERPGTCIGGTIQGGIHLFCGYHMEHGA